jgi:hypothetical protein
MVTRTTSELLARRGILCVVYVMSANAAVVLTTSTRSYSSAKEHAGE